MPLPDETMIAARHIALVGPTASGKSALALELARRRGPIELISADAMQVYRGMDVGTAKPTSAERGEVPHHLIDVIDPSDDYSVSRFQADVAEAIRSIEAAGATPLLVGGTGLYVRAVIDDLAIPGRFPEARAQVESEPDTARLHERLRELDPVAAARMEPSNRRRVVRALEVTIGAGRPFSSFGPGLAQHPPTRWCLAGLRVPRPLLEQRIRARLAEQLQMGFVDEVRSLATRPDGLSTTARQALGYRELLEHVEAGVPLHDAVEQAVTRTIRFAKRQERWFRRDPRIDWFDIDDDPLAALPALLAWFDAAVPPR